MNQLRSELLKLHTTRTPAVLLLAGAALTLLGVLVEGLSTTAAELAQEDQQRMLFAAATSGVLFATFAGLIAVTSEFRYGTIRPTLLFEPRRRVVLTAKLAAVALTGVLFAVVCVALSFGAGLAILAARDVDVAVTGSHTLALTLGTLATAALSAMLGCTVGALIRNQVGAVVVLAAYSLAVESGAGRRLSSGRGPKARSRRGGRGRACSSARNCSGRGGRRRARRRGRRVGADRP